MPIFEYEGKTKQGATRKGKIEAVNDKAVVDSLRAVGIYPLDINLEKKSFYNVDLSQLERVTLKDIYIFSREFSYSISSGMGIVRALNVLKNETENKKLKVIISDVADSVQKGHTLSSSFGEHKELPKMFISMISVGEAGGKLDDVLKKLADYYEKEYKQRQKVKQALTYPIVIFTFAIVIIGVLIIKVVPTFTSMILQNGGKNSDIPIPTKIVMAVSSTLIHFWWIYIIAAVAIVIAFKYLIKIKRYNYDKLMTNIIVVGKINRKLISSRFARTFGMLINSGVTILSAIEVSSGVVQNTYVETLLMGTQEELQKGAGLGDTLEAVNIFPKMLTQMIKIGEESGTLDSVLDKTAEFYDGEIELAMAQLTSLIEPVMIIFLAIIVGFVIVSIILPILELYNLAGK